MRASIKNLVFKCGEKNPFIPCLNSTTKPLKIKFTPESQVATLVEKNIGKYLFDTGEVSKLNGIFT